MSRLPQLSLETLSAEQRRVYDAIASGPRGVVAGPMLAWLNCPKFAERAQALGLYCRFGSSLPPRLSELAILTVAVHWRAAFEWEAHAQIARQAGLPAEVMSALQRGETPIFTDPGDAVVYGFIVELLRDRRIDEATWTAALGQLRLEGVVDLIGVVGYYSLIAMTLIGFEIPPMSGSGAYMSFEQ